MLVEGSVYEVEMELLGLTERAKVFEDIGTVTHSTVDELRAERPPLQDGMG
jgi:hypothetical protein